MNVLKNAATDENLNETLEKIFNNIEASAQGAENEYDFKGLFDDIDVKSRIYGTHPKYLLGIEIISERDFQDYQGTYLDLRESFMKRQKINKENINDDIVFEIELIKQIEVNIDYILMLVSKYHESNCTDKSILVNIEKAISSSIKLRSKKTLDVDKVSPPISRFGSGNNRTVKKRGVIEKLMDFFEKYSGLV